MTTSELMDGNQFIYSYKLFFDDTSETANIYSNNVFLVSDLKASYISHLLECDKYPNYIKRKKI
jgi:hypothetical protein